MHRPKSSPVQLVSAVTHHVVNGQCFATVADLADAVKAQCAKLKIPYTSEIVSMALGQVVRLRPEVLAKPEIARAAAPPKDEAPELSRAEAARVYADIMARFERETAPAATPEAPPDFPKLMRVR